MGVEDSPLGREVAYPTHLDPALLHPIPRAPSRAQLGLDADALPFIGHDRWHAYELSWLGPRGKPEVATLGLVVPASSPCLVESKSLKLYLNSLNGTRFAGADAVLRQVEADVSAAAGSPVVANFGTPGVGVDDSACIDDQDIEITSHGPPDPSLLDADPADAATEHLSSALLKSNCPVTGQPDWADVAIAYAGPRIDRAGLLRYLVGYRDHAGFHEDCVERIFLDVLRRCRPQSLSVEARYTRRGGLDINPWRATPGHPAPVARRTIRQ